MWGVFLSFRLLNKADKHISIKIAKCPKSTKPVMIWLILTASRFNKNPQLK